MDAVSLWPYIERAGAVSALLMVLAIGYLLRQIGREQTTNAGLQAKLDAANEARIEDAKTNIPIIQENTAATKQMNILVQGLLEERRR